MHDADHDVIIARTVEYHGGDHQNTIESGGWNPPLRCIGALTKLKSDNAKEFTSAKTTKTLRETYVERKLTEPHHLQQNLAEARGGRLKHAVQQLLTATQAPLIFWCYAVEYMAFLRQRTATRRKVKGRTSVEAITGGIPDISKCRFPFWQPIWYYILHSSSRLSTPTNATGEFPRIQ